MPGNHSLEAYLNRLPKEKLLICRDSILEKSSLSLYDQHVLRLVQKALQKFNDEP